MLSTAFCGTELDRISSFTGSVSLLATRGPSFTGSSTTYWETVLPDPNFAPSMNYTTNDASWHQHGSNSKASCRESAIHPRKPAAGKLQSTPGSQLAQRISWAKQDVSWNVFHHSASHQLAAAFCTCVPSFITFLSILWCITQNPVLHWTPISFSCQ